MKLFAPLWLALLRVAAGAGPTADTTATAPEATTCNYSRERWRKQAEGRHLQAGSDPPTAAAAALRQQQQEITAATTSDPIANLTLLPQDDGTSSPAALDGGQYGFYLARARTPSTKWTINIQVGEDVAATAILCRG
jgi:hypothetical protein